jgi:hypothetical protein
MLRLQHAGGNDDGNRRDIIGGSGGSCRCATTRLVPGLPAPPGSHGSRSARPEFERDTIDSLRATSVVTGPMARVWGRSTSATRDCP